MFTEDKVGRRRVVVTGMGVLSPVGSTVEETWNNLVNGVSGAQVFPEIMDCTDFPFSTVGYPTKVAAPVKEFDATKYVPTKQALDPTDYGRLTASVGVGTGGAGRALTARLGG